MSTLGTSKASVREWPLSMDQTGSSTSQQLSQLLAISFSYPPQSEPRAIQVSRLLRHLNVATVLICEGTSEASSKPDATTKILRVPNQLSGLKRLSTRIAARFTLPVLFRTPDHLASWKNQVLEQVERLVNDEKYCPDVVATFSFPLIDSIIGLELKRKYGFPWLAHFSDPWVDSPFKSYDPLTKALNVRLERMVMEQADRIVFTSPETAELVMKKYDRALHEKVRTVPHAYESKLFGVSASTPDDRFAIRYLGDLYLKRTPKPLFDALQTLLSSEPDLVNRFRFEIVGEIHKLDLSALGLARLPEGLIQFKPRVDYAESLSLMRSASGLMVIDAPVEKEAKSVFLPSKLIEYVGAGRPIIGLTPQGTAADVIHKLGGWVADPANPEELASVMHDFLTSVLNRGMTDDTEWGNIEARREFEATAVATRFDSVLRELL